MTGPAAFAVPDELPTGLRMPAEWEPHDGTWFTWPHSKPTWPGCLAEAERALASAVRELCVDEIVYINVLDAAHGERVARLVDAADGAVEYLTIPSNDAWCRDHGALFVRRRDGRRLALDFGFNAWGGKYPPWDLDAGVARAMAAHVHVPSITLPTVLEGGALDTNGQGVMLTTASCVLNPNRNAAPARAAAERLLAACFGTPQVIWLEGDVPGDDTDGHVDNLARFVAPDSVLSVTPQRPRTAAEHALAANLVRIEEAGRRFGLTLNAQPLPVPQTFQAQTGLPASYANFYIGNRVVLMPVFGDPQDDAACALVEAAFPGRRLQPIDCSSIIVGLGSLHCLSQQLPAAGDE
jgi:agmatine deiminase